MRTTVAFVFAAFVFAIGALGGYAVRAVTTPVVAAAKPAVSACPAGSHVAVWYSARAWGCVSDQPSATPPR
jgi:hypothetical protein